MSPRVRLEYVLLEHGLTGAVCVHGEVALLRTETIGFIWEQGHESGREPSPHPLEVSWSPALSQRAERVATLASTRVWGVRLGVSAGPIRASFVDFYMLSG